MIFNCDYCLIPVVQMCDIVNEENVCSEIP